MTLECPRGDIVGYSSPWDLPCFCRFHCYGKFRCLWLFRKCELYLHMSIYGIQDVMLCKSVDVYWNVWIHLDVYIYYSARFRADHKFVVVLAVASCILTWKYNFYLLLFTAPVNHAWIWCEGGKAIENYSDLSRVQAIVKRCCANREWHPPVWELL